MNENNIKSREGEMVVYNYIYLTEESKTDLDDDKQVTVELKHDVEEETAEEVKFKSSRLSVVK